MFKFNYSEKIGRLKTTVWTSWRLLALLWSIDKWLLIANALAATVPAIAPFVIAYVFKLLIDQIVLIVAGSPPNFPYITTIFIGAFIVYTIQSLAFSAQDYLGRLLYTKVPVSLYQLVLDKISNLDIAYFEDSEFKNTLEKVRDSYTWKPLNMMEYLLYIFQSLIQVIVALVIL